MLRGVLWQLCVLNGDISVCAASCKCFEACGCHSVACDNKETQKSLGACYMAGRGGVLQANSVLTDYKLYI